jgi:phospholipid/cholesterol/gamma-HCH transport system substrate-binding protein
MTTVERDARYATVALFALACIVAAFAFVWWYSGRGDRRDYQSYEIYFEGSVSGLSEGSPVRYLGVDVGRVTSLSVDKDDPRRVKVLAEIDTTAPITGNTLASLGLLGLTGLLYIDLQQDTRAPAASPQPLQKGDRHPVIPSRKGTIEASLERLPDVLGQAATVMSRVEKLLGEENVRSVGASLANIERASKDLPAVMEDARQLAADLRGISASTLKLTTRLNQTVESTQPDIQALLANARATSEKLQKTADGLDRMVNANDGALGRNAGASLADLQQLVIDARAASYEVKDLARALRENPSSLIREQGESGVEIPR